MDTQTLIDKITKAITFAFKSDGTKPGLTISWIEGKESAFYTSIVRWVSGEKAVFCSTRNADLNTALVVLAKNFLETVEIPSNPMDELTNFLRPTTNTKD